MAVNYGTGLNALKNMAGWKEASSPLPKSENKSSGFGIDALLNMSAKSQQSSTPQGRYEQYKKASTQLQKKDNVQTWGSETTEKPDNIARIKELKDQLARIDEYSGFDVNGTYDWAGERKKVEDELRGLGQNVVDRGKLLFGTAEQGAGQIVTGATSLLDALLGAPAQEVHTMLNQTALDLGFGKNGKNPLGDTNLITRLNQWAQNTAKSEREYYAQNAAGDKAAEAVNKYGTMVMQAIPAAVMAFGTGGTSLATTAGLQSIAAANSAGNLGYIAEMSSQALRNMASNPQFQLSFIQEAGNAYQNALDEGANEEEAMLYSMLYGSTAATIEVGGADEALGGIQKLPNNIRAALEKGQAKPVVAWLRGMLSEAGEEVSQGVFERGLKSVYTDVPIYGTGDANAVINPDAMKEEAIGAGITSAILGGGQILASDAFSTNTLAPVTEDTGNTSAQTVEEATEQSAQMEKSYAAQANEILRDPVRKAEYEAKHGKLEGSNTEQAKIISNTLRNEAERPAQAQPNAKTFDTFGNIQDSSFQYDPGTVTTPKQTTDSYVRGLLMDITPASANEILRNPEYRASFERVTGKNISNVSNNKARDIIMNSAIEPGSRNGITPDHSDVFSTQSERTFRYAPTSAEVVERIVNDAVNGAREAKNTGTEAQAKTPANNAISEPFAQGDINTPPTVKNTITQPPTRLNVENNADINTAPVASAERGIVGETATDESGFTGKVVETKDSYADANNIESGTHVRHSDRQVNDMARAEIDSKGADGVLKQLSEKKTTKDGKESYGWNDVDTVAAQLAMDEIARQAEAETDPTKKEALYRKLGEAATLYEKAGTEEGRALRQRNASGFKESATGITSEAAGILYVGKGGKLRGKLTEKGKAHIMSFVTGFAKRLDAIRSMKTDGGNTAEKTDALIALIKDVSAARGTTSPEQTGVEAKMIDRALREIASSDGGVDFLQDLCTQQVRSVALDYVKPKIIDSLKSIRYLNMLSNPATWNRNFISNTVMGSLVDPIANDAGVIVDFLASLVTGERTVGFDRGYFSEAAVKSMDNAAKRSFLEVVLDAETGNEAGKYAPSGRQFKMVGNWFERYLSTVAKYQGLALKTTDQIAKGATEAETKRGLTSLGKRAKGLDIEAEAEKAALHRTLQDNGAVTEAVIGVRNSLDKIGIGNEKTTGKYGLGSDIAPFTQVSVNAVLNSAEYNPVGGVVNTAINLARLINAKANGQDTSHLQRELSISAGRTMTGAGIIALAAVMASKGLIELHDDDDKDRSMLEKALGMNGLQINLSAFARWATGEDVTPRGDDIRVGLGYIPQLNQLFTIGAVLSEAYKDDGSIDMADIANATLDGMVASVMDFPAVATITGMINAGKYAEIDEDSIFGERAQKAGAVLGNKLGNSVAGLTVPNVVRAVAAGTDSTERDLYTSGGVIGKAADYIKGGIPGLRQTLPAKLDNWGREITNGGGWGQFADKVIRPAEITKGTTDNISEYILGLADSSGDNGIIPNRKAPNSVTYDGYRHKLTREEKETYQKTYGDAYRQMINDILNIRGYDGYSDEIKAAVISEAERMATDKAKSEFLEAAGKGETGSKEDALTGTERARYATAKAGYAEAKKTENYDLIDEIIKGQFGKLSDRAVDALGNNGQEMAKISEAVGGGLSGSDAWFTAKEAMSGNGSDKKFDEVSAMAKYLTDKDVDVLAKVTLSENQLTFYETARAAGIKPEEIASLYNSAKNEKGNITQDTAGTVLMQIEGSFGADELQTMWEALTNGKKTYAEWRAGHKK